MLYGVALRGVDEGERRAGVQVCTIVPTVHACVHSCACLCTVVHGCAQLCTVACIVACKIVHCCLHSCAQLCTSVHTLSPPSAFQILTYIATSSVMRVVCKCIYLATVVHRCAHPGGRQPSADCRPPGEPPQAGREPATGEREGGCRQMAGCQWEGGGKHIQSPPPGKKDTRGKILFSPHAPQAYATSLDCSLSPALRRTTKTAAVVVVCSWQPCVADLATSSPNGSEPAPKIAMASLCR